ncbi:MAG: fumarylacetoacetate hydrolase family protein [Pseudolysinimonas sp.]
MSIVRFSGPERRQQVGVRSHDRVHPIDGVDIAALLQLPIDDLRQKIDVVVASGASLPLADLTLLAPIDGRTEVWGAGVTYFRSREARMEESRFDRVYLDVYEADRPELFFKSAAWRVLGDGEHGGMRHDSTDSIPEPEVAIVVNSRREIVGGLICNDFTSRSIEAENPIYLPQAKTFTGSCALSNEIVPWWEIEHPTDLTISLNIQRAGATWFEGSASTSAMKRSYQELVTWLFAATDFPDGVVLSTGTCIVPELGHSMLKGDEVTVRVDQLGSLTNTMSFERSR